MLVTYPVCATKIRLRHIGNGENVNKITALLEEWGKFVADHIDFSDEYGENIIYRAGVLGGYVDPGESEHKILCPDMPPHLRKVEVAVKGLPRWQHRCIVAYFCAPLKDDGNRYTKRELAKIIGTPGGKDSFESHVQRGKRRLEFILK